jgi:hypothetical protein
MNSDGFIERQELNDIIWQDGDPIPRFRLSSLQDVKEQPGEADVFARNRQQPRRANQRCFAGTRLRSTAELPIRTARLWN